MTESQYIAAASAADFDDKVIQRSHQVPVLVDFWAEWCGPCRSLGPVLHEIVEEYQGGVLLVTVDTDREMELAGRFQVRSLPTVKLFRDGRVVDEFMGALPPAQVRAFLQRHIEREPDERLEEAERLLAANDTAGAVALLQQVLNDEPKNLDVRLRCARVMLDSGDADGANRLLDTVPVESAQEPAVLRLKALLEFHRLVDPSHSEDQVESDARQASPGALRELAARKVLKGDFDTALSLQLELLRKDKRFADNAAQKDMLSVFELVDDAELVNRYRRQMANLLY
ncbi:MAG TPA: thioredoxin [Arenicellales bacterium]|nr:thioredoxin [Arenicellales bacterium]